MKANLTIDLLPDKLNLNELMGVKGGTGEGGNPTCDAKAVVYDCKADRNSVVVCKGQGAGVTICTAPGSGTVTPIDPPEGEDPGEPNPVKP